VAAGVFLAGLAVPAAAALNLPRPAPAPTLTLPPVTVPTLPVPVPVPAPPPPTITVPSVPIPTVPAPPPPPPSPTIPTSSTPEPTPPASTAPSGSRPPAPGSGGAEGTPPSSGQPGTAGAPATGNTRAAQAAAIRPELPRPRIARFRVARGGILRVTVWQQAPHCRLVGSYVLAADRGANLLRLPRRVGKHRLRPGTYRFVAAAHGATVFDVRFRLSRGKKHLRVRRDRLADVCLASMLFPAGAQAIGLPVRGGGSPPASGSSGTGPSLGRAAPFVPPILHELSRASSSPLARAIFFALLAGAIALLAAASLPEGIVPAAAAGAFVARHRAAITVGGFALVLAAAVLLRLV
jgi:hypothetical protein